MFITTRTHAPDGRRRVPRAVRTTIVSVALALGMVLGVSIGGSPAHALGADLNGGRISWAGNIPCNDGNGASGIDVDTRGASYNPPSAGWYHAQVFVYSKAGRQLIAGRASGQKYLSGTGYRIYPPVLDAYYSQFRTNAEAVMFVYRWDARGYWVEVARESVNCSNY